MTAAPCQRILQPPDGLYASSRHTNLAYSNDNINITLQAVAQRITSSFNELSMSGLKIYDLPSCGGDLVVLNSIQVWFLLLMLFLRFFFVSGVVSDTYILHAYVSLYTSCMNK